MSLVFEGKSEGGGGADVGIRGMAEDESSGACKTLADGCIGQAAVAENGCFLDTARGVELKLDFDCADF